MALQMIDRQQRLVARHRQRLGGDKADHNPPDQPRPGGRGNRVHLGERHPGIVQRGGDQRRQPLGMSARGDLRHHPAIGSVRVVLRGDPLRDDPAPVGHQRRGGFVARRFYA